MKPGQESTCQCRRLEFHPWVRKIPWRRKWKLTPVFLPGKSHGQRSLAGYSPWGGERVEHNLATNRQNTELWPAGPGLLLALCKPAGP